ncbi:MAG: hypothetical protein ACXU9C_18565 [Xanthobacteraceae bacterium]
MPPRSDMAHHEFPVTIKAVVFDDTLYDLRPVAAVVVAMSFKHEH